MSEKPKTKPISRLATVITLIKRGIAGIVIFGVFGLCSLLIGSMLFAYLKLPSIGWIAAHNIEANLQFEIPANSKNVRFYYSWTDETKVRFQFSAPPEEILTWLEHPNLCFDIPLTGENVYEQGWHFHSSWWNPASVTTLVSGVCRTDNNHLNHISQSILIDQTHSDYWTVYFIVWYM
jgi:hypothetical protein